MELILERKKGALHPASPLCILRGKSNRPDYPGILPHPYRLHL